jgi:hypothetical protein
MLTVGRGETANAIDEFLHGSPSKQSILLEVFESALGAGVAHRVDESQSRREVDV